MGTQRERATEEIDRLSNLPNGIINVILSYLDIEDIFCIMVAVKRWKGVCLTIPNVYIHLGKHQGNLMSGDRFCSNLDSYMHMRNGPASDIQCFRLFWLTGYSTGAFRGDGWIKDAVRCKVKNLYLNVEGRKHFALPVVPCPSLEVFYLNLHQNKFDPLSLVNFSAKLKELTLDDVNLSSFKEWFELLLVLEKLCLRDVKGLRRVSIYSNSLKWLRISKYRMDDLEQISVIAGGLLTMDLAWSFYPPNNQSLAISAPKLQELSLEGTLLSGYHLADVPDLQRVYLYPFRQPDFRYRVRSNLPNWDELLRCCICAENLHISGDLIKVMFKQGCALPSFRTKNLFLHMLILDDSLVPHLASFLRAFPCLEFLQVCPDDDTTFQPLSPRLHMASQFPLCYWESQNLPFIQHQLKQASVELLGGENEISFTNYLLKNAKSLTKLEVLYSVENEVGMSLIDMNSSVAFLPIPAPRNLEEFTVPGTKKIVKVGDYVIVRSAKEPIARVEGIEVDRWGFKRITIKRYHKVRSDIVLSEKFEVVADSAIEERCTIHSNGREKSSPFR